VDDLRHEFWGMILTDWLVGLLRGSFKPSSFAMVDRVAELGEFLRLEATPQLPPWAPPAVHQFLLGTAENLATWADACRPYFSPQEVSVGACALHSPASVAIAIHGVPAAVAAR
jgi:hypothetical protein